MPESQIRDRVLGLSRGLWVGLLVIVAVGIGAGWMMFARYQPPGVSRPAENARVAPAGTFAPAAKPATPTASPVLRFDIARIGPDGNAVIAGRAAPGATVTILDGEQPIGTARANGRGEFVVLPDTPLPGGARTLRLRQTGPDGSQVEGPDALVLVVPPNADETRQPALAVLMPPDGTPREGTPLQGRPRVPQGPRQNAQDTSPRLGLAAIDYGTGGAIQPGGHVVVQPGDSLWLLARQTYGAGSRYTAIFAANRARIRDPDLIYPGQTFSMPAMVGTGSGATPTASSSMSSSSSRSR